MKTFFQLSGNRLKYFKDIKSLLILAFLLFAIVSCNKEETSDTNTTSTPTPSTSSNALWQQTTYSYPIAGGVHALLTVGSSIYAGSDHGVYRSGDTGNTWQAANTGALLGCWAIANNGTTLFAGNINKVVISTNNGNSWTDISTGLRKPSTVSTLLYNGTKLFVGYSGDGIYVSSNNGASWIDASSGLTSLGINYLTAIGTTLFAATTTGGIFRSSNSGSTWVQVNTGLTGTLIYSLTVIGTALFAGTDYGIFISVNNGNSWSTINNGITVFPGKGLLAPNGNDLYFHSTINNQTFETKNNGASWTAFDSIPDFNTSLGPVSIFALSVNDGYLFAGTNLDGVWKLGPL